MQQTKMRRFITLPKILAFGTLLLLVLLSLRSSLDAQAVTEGYGADQQLQRGILVRLKKNDTTKIEPVSQKDMDQLHGVVVDPNDAPVTLSSDGKKIFVATAGHYEVLVNNQNGSIAAGDYITVSAVDGVGMKAGTVEPIVIGRALGSFDGKSGAISTAQLKDSSGATRNINIGRVSVDIGVARNPLLKNAEPNVPEILRRASEAIAGKPVNAVRVYVGLVVFVISTIVAGVLLYGGVRSAIISIGRNPLSKKSIVRGMLQVILVGLTIFISGVFGVYLLLKL